MNLFRFIPGYEDYIYQADKEPLLFLFLAFLVTFALVRLYTRLARTRSWGSGNVGGVHMHHMVVGVILMVIAGLLSFTQYGYNEIVYSVSAIIFGAGVALTLDEFAMLFHLKDVYWTEEGRSSIDAMLMGLAGAGLLLVSSAPFGATPNDDGRITFFTVISLHVVVATITFLKRKPFLGVVAIFVPIVGWVTAIRLAKPDSPWARWRYDPGRGRRPDRRARKLGRSQQRFEQGRLGRFERWFSDLVGGAPHLPSASPEGRHE